MEAKMSNIQSKGVEPIFGGVQCWSGIRPLPLKNVDLIQEHKRFNHCGTNFIIISTVAWLAGRRGSQCAQELPWQIWQQDCTLMAPSWRLCCSDRRQEQEVTSTVTFCHLRFKFLSQCCVNVLPVKSTTVCLVLLGGRFRVLNREIYIYQTVSVTHVRDPSG